MTEKLLWKKIRKEFPESNNPKEEREFDSSGWTGFRKDQQYAKGINNTLFSLV